MGKMLTQVQATPQFFVRVTKAIAPALYDALDIISHDSGARAGWDFYEVPTSYLSSIAIWEPMLAKLGDYDRQTLCIGEMEEQDEIVRQIGGEQLHAFLNAFFESEWKRGMIDAALQSSPDGMGENR